MGRTLSGWDYLSGREGQTGDFQKMKFEIDCIETKIIYIEIYRYIYISRYRHGIQAIIA
jgi:hypothetical protein